MKSSARSIVDTIVLFLRDRGINPWTRIYSRLIQQIRTEDYRDVDWRGERLEDQARYRSLLGFMTTGTTRDFLYKTILQRAVNLNIDKLFDKTLILELVGLSTRNGRIDHKIGANDDMVVAYLIACWFVFEGMNHDIYGLKSEDILAAITAKAVTKTFL
jgi:hypothetical protein